MKKAILTILLGSASYWGWAQNVSGPTETGAAILFSTTELNYGQVALNSDGTKKFEFTNTGTKPLIVTNVMASCGCTAPEWPREPIKPGEKGTITVKYNTAIPGAFQKSIRVFSNASPEPVLLIIKGEVKPEANEGNQK